MSLSQTKESLNNPMFHVERLPDVIKTLIVSRETFIVFNKPIEP